MLDYLSIGESWICRFSGPSHLFLPMPQVKILIITELESPLHGIMRSFRIPTVSGSSSWFN